MFLMFLNILWCIINSKSMVIKVNIINFNKTIKESLE
ncbi:hypothetical protein K144312032_10210 [Clostridium tetani]|nr:hypothetical protein K144312032_10210 [Clostridium tetani]BDR75325.1 hypothetical protein K154306013_09850 [Clostridium tetani]BDR86415.1 hypothetical protein N071400001_10230 [Clostridium tetani]CDI49246.1 hypothetical protein BN906_01241 [Clostridium tetani 12124569]